MVGLSEIAIAMSDPFGDDQADFNLNAFLQSVIGEAHTAPLHSPLDACELLTLYLYKYPTCASCALCVWCRSVYDNAVGSILDAKFDSKSPPRGCLTPRTCTLSTLSQTLSAQCTLLSPRTRALVCVGGAVAVQVAAAG